MSSYATVWIDDVDVTNLSLDGSVTRRLNRTSTATVRLPLDGAIGGAGSKMKVAINGDLFFHGFILLCETTADEDTGYVTYNASDPTEIWNWRPVRDFDGDYTIVDLINDFPNAPTIIEHMLANSRDATASADGGIPDGELYLDIDTGPYPLFGVDVSGMPVDWPMTMAEVATLLCSTGELDIVIEPIDVGINMGLVKTYHGDYGTDHTGDVIFEFATGARNVRNIRQVEDMSNTANKLRYLLGPRCGTRDDPDGDQHWCGSIEGDFAPVTQARQAASQAMFGTRFDIKVWDGDESKAMELWRRLWNIEAWLRAWPMRMTNITPTRDTEIGTFDIGDLITVNAPLVIARSTPTVDYDGVGSVQRIYAYTISWDEDSVLELGELEASPSQEGFGQ